MSNESPAGILPKPLPLKLNELFHEVRHLFTTLRSRLITVAPTVTAISLMAGNTGLLLRRGLQPNLDTAVGFLWIASDYALRQKSRHPVAAPRLNAAGLILGSLLLSASGFHTQYTDWNRVRTPLGYIPAALVVGFQKELRRVGQRLASSPVPIARFLGAVLQHPYALSALLCSYGVVELMQSALHAHDAGLVAISAAYGLGTLFLSLLDYGRTGTELDDAPATSQTQNPLATKPL
jgi:hypothetical protein